VGAPVASLRMDETHAPPAAVYRSGRRRPPWLLAGVLAAILAFLTVCVLAHSPVLDVDGWIRGAVLAREHSAGFRWLEAGRYAPVYLLVEFGNNQVAVPVLGLSALIAAIRDRSVRPPLAAVAAVVLLLGIVIPAKILIARAGPGLPPVAHGAMGVFPSGHSATSGVCLGLAALLLARGLPGLVRRAMLAGVAVLCSLVGAALVWGDYHWFTDVVGGWALAALIIMASLWVTGLGGNPGAPADKVRGGVAVSTDPSREQADDSART
jgi:membrane-associated phospholipid phosphatase